MPQHRPGPTATNRMNISHILLDDDDDYSLPRGVKRSRDGSPRPSQPQESRFARPPSPHNIVPLNRRQSNGPTHNTLSNPSNACPARNNAENSEMSSTHYGSSPFHGLFDTTDNEDFEALLDRVDGLSPQHSRRSSYPHGPSTDTFWEALGRSSHQLPFGYQRPDEFERYFQDQNREDAMGNRQSNQNASDSDDQTSRTTTPYGSLFEDSPGRNAPRQLGEIDLTQESDNMTPPHTSHRKRKRGHHDDDSSDGAPGPSNHRDSKRARPSDNDVEPIESISLLDDDDPTTSSLLQKQRMDQISTQNEASPASFPSAAASSSSSKPKKQPTKLTGMQCTICMDVPHELTATTCGHVFCRECIQGWVGAPDMRGRGKNCPACRTVLLVNTARMSKSARSNKHTLVALEFMKRSKVDAVA